MFTYINKGVPTLPGSLLQNDLNIDVARFTAHKKRTLQPLYLL